MAKIYLLILSTLLFLGIASCANIAAPSGGPGKVQPPTIASSSVQSGTTNFNDKEITLEFNNYMNRSSVIENLNISPRAKYTYKWKGKKLNIKLNDNLEENTTYTLQLDANYTDYYNNSPKESFVTVFSTGNNIQNGTIHGSIVGTENKLGIKVFAYNITKINANSINYSTTEPDYKTTVGTNGNFTISALKDGKYRILAVDDVDKNGLITIKQDKIGISCFDPTLIAGNAEADVNIFINNKLFNTDSTKTKDTNDTKKTDTTSETTSESQKTLMTVSGTVPQYNELQEYGNIKLLLYNDKEEHIVNIDSKGAFKFDKANEGIYHILLFVDENNNEKFDKGSLSPFDFCELFFPVNESLNIRNKWNITDLVISTKYKFANHTFFKQIRNK